MYTNQNRCVPIDLFVMHSPVWVIFFKMVTLPPSTKTKQNRVYVHIDLFGLHYVICTFLKTKTTNTSYFTVIEAFSTYNSSQQVQGMILIRIDHIISCVLIDLLGMHQLCYMGHYRFGNGGLENNEHISTANLYGDLTNNPRLF